MQINKHKEKEKILTLRKAFPILRLLQTIQHIKYFDVLIPSCVEKYFLGDVLSDERLLCLHDSRVNDVIDLILTEGIS